MSEMLNTLVVLHPSGIPENVLIDYGDLSFIRATGVVLLNNFVRWMMHGQRKVSFINHTYVTAANIYLDDCGFFHNHLGAPVRSTARVRSTTYPLTQIGSGEVHSMLDLKLMPWLADRLSLTAASLYDYRACISELFNNISDHANLTIGSIIAQHHPKENRVLIAVADWGVGLPNTVRRREPLLSDSAAIVRSVEEGFSAKSHPNNRGAGLPLLLDKVIRHNGGCVTIFSQRGIVSFGPSNVGTDISVHSFPETGYSPGTSFEISLRTDTIERLPDETEELSWD